MSIAVILPLFNGGHWIREAIDSVLAQELVPNEIVVVDDGSTDNSPELVRAYRKVKLVTNPRKGSSSARNFGLLQTSSPFIAFLDQDDVWHPAHLRLLVNTLHQHPEANTVFATASSFEHGFPEYQTTSVQVNRFDPWTRFPFTIGIAGPSVVLIRRVALEVVGGYGEEKAQGMGDALLSLKLAVLHPLLQLTSCTVGKRMHANQQWLQVRALGLSYLDFRFEVMCRALEFRRNRKPSDPSLAIYQQRLEALRTLRQLTEVILMDNLEKVPLVALQLERELSTDPPEFLRHAFYCLTGALFKIYEKERLREERDLVFLKLLSIWPENACLTRNALNGLISETPQVS